MITSYKSKIYVASLGQFVRFLQDDPSYGISFLIKLMLPRPQLITLNGQTLIMVR